MNRKEVVIGASGVVLAIIALVAIVFIWSTVDNLGKKVDDLEQRLAAIENKTWHTVGDFTMSQSNAAETFDIVGEVWRMSYVFNSSSGSIAGGYNLRVIDADGNVVGGLGTMELLGLRDSGKGVLYIPEGYGSFLVEIESIESDFTFSFKVEEFY
jgi:membrane protein implicated in regulation of membrane protease activity